MAASRDPLHSRTNPTSVWGLRDCHRRTRTGTHQSVTLLPFRYTAALVRFHLQASYAADPPFVETVWAHQERLEVARLVSSAVPPPEFISISAQTQKCNILVVCNNT